MPNSLEVSILVSTYNGEKYIAEQLDSLIVQSYKNMHIYIRDDGSTDGTYSILQRYAELYPDLISISKGSNLGVIGSFNHLMESTSSELYATCDQDDIWMPNKIMEQVEIFENSSLAEGSPFMCFSDPVIYQVSTESEIVLSDIQSMNVEKLMSNYKNLIAMNPVAGCTMLFCDKAKELYLSASQNRTVMHDHLMAVIVSLHGGLVFCDKQHVLYRQHGQNVLGNKDTSIRYLLNRLVNICSLFKHDLVLLNTVNSNFSDKISHIFRKIYLNVRRFGSF